MTMRQLTMPFLLVAILAATGCQDREKVTARAVGTAKEGSSLHARVEYVSGVVTMREGDSITVHVLNYCDFEQTCQIEIYRDTRSGAKEVSDNEAYRVKPRGLASCRYSAKGPGEYWVLVKGEMSPLAPQATFSGGKSADKTNENGTSTLVFKPGDFLKVEALLRPSFDRGTEFRKTTEEIRTQKKTEETRKVETRKESDK